MLPPLTFPKAPSSPDGRTGQVHSASGNKRVPPSGLLTAIVWPVSLQVDAAQSAYCMFLHITSSVFDFVPA